MPRLNDEQIEAILALNPWLVRQIALRMILNEISPQDGQAQLQAIIAEFQEIGAA